MKIYLLLYLIVLLPQLLVYIEPFVSVSEIFIISFDSKYLFYCIIMLSSVVSIYYFISIFDNDIDSTKTVLGLIISIVFEIISIIFLFIQSTMYLYFMISYIPVILSLELGVVITFTISCIVGDEYYSNKSYVMEKTKEKLGGF